MPKKKFTTLTNKEAKKFLKKYEYIIHAEAYRRSYITGMDAKDLMQECRFKLLKGFDSYDQERGTERNWAISVIKKTLNGIWNQQLCEKRVMRIIDSEGNSVPVRDLEYHTDNIMINEKQSPHTQGASDNTYTGENSGPITIFGTVTFSQEEYLEALNYLTLLKSGLPKESYEIIKENLDPKLEEQIPIHISTDKEHQALSLNHFPIMSIVGSAEKEEEVQKLSQIAEFFIRVCGVPIEKILKRTKTNDINLKRKLKIAEKLA